ncbi:MAG TPA: ASCH domain-containing protein [Candidatus Nanoarchaeia archaeon]|nr:ASCH domain-containing protein [Candidatus Nanoarchaeia archaeon]
MKKLRFAPHLVPLVLNGSKTTTWRLFDDKDLQVGDEFEMLHSETQEKFATGKIISINITKFKNLTESDHKGHKSYKDVIKAYQKYYSDKKVDGNTELKIIKFKLI